MDLNKELENYTLEKDNLPKKSLFSGEDLINLNIFEDDVIATYYGRVVVDLGILPVMDGVGLSVIYNRLLLDAGVFSLDLDGVNRVLSSSYSSFTSFYSEYILNDRRVSSFLDRNDYIMSRYFKKPRKVWNISNTSEFSTISPFVDSDKRYSKLDVVGPLHPLNHAPSGVSSKVYLVGRNAGKDDYRILTPKYLRLFQNGDMVFKTCSIKKRRVFSSGILFSKKDIVPLDSNIFI